MVYYNTAHELLDVANRLGCPISEVILLSEIQIQGKSREEILDCLKQRYRIMKDSATKALLSPQTTFGSLIDGVASAQYAHSLSGTLSGQWMNRLMAYALSCSEVNASMGRICACPTAGSCGILPAVLLSLGEKYLLSEDQLLKGLLCASGIGTLIVKHATVSGAEGGCQAECGAAAAMAAAAAVELMGGTPEQSFHAASLALMNCMGLICDPVAGLVSVPCAFRNASQAVSAVICADMALSGINSVIPFDEVVKAMHRVGKQLPDTLRETSMGGIATTPTAEQIAFRLYKQNKASSQPDEFKTEDSI